jgi:membrane protein YqaA with SNARE-associated domain
MSFLSSLSQWLVQTLEPWGGPGLMLIAICDSSFISLPEVNDAALMALSINHPYRMWELVAFTVIGSVLGCLVLYAIGRKGGEAMLQKRFAADKIVRVRGWYQKYGMLAVIVPSLLPPPLPFKIFVLSAGAFQVPWPRFIIGVAIGRSIRYFTEGLLAVWYGQQAVQIVADNFPIVGMVLAAVIIIGAIVYVSMRRRKVVASLILLPLLLAGLNSGCITTKVVPPDQRLLPSVAFTREQALQKLESMSGSITTFRSAIGFEGSTAVEDFKRKSAPHLAGTLVMKRSGEIALRAGKFVQSVFELKSDGKNYQIYIDLNKELYVGQEDGPPWKQFTHLDKLGNQFVNLRPKQLREALMFDFSPFLDNRDIGVLGSREPEIRDLRTYFTINFFDTSSSPKDGKLVQRIWFDLSTENADVARRQTFTPVGDLETDTRYSMYQQIPGSSVRYPSVIEFRIVDTDTLIRFDVDPTQVALNQDIPPGILELDPHPGAKVHRFEPRVSGTVSEQR